MYLTRIMSLIPVTSFSCQEITKGLSNSPSAIIYKLFHDAREFDTLKSKKVPQSLEIGLFFCQIFIFII